MPRLDYDRIAHLYDSQPFREKQADPHLLSFAKARGGKLRALEVACGTGNQLVANRAALPKGVSLVGMDRFRGMLAQGQKKLPRASWLQGDAGTLPFADEAFDFVSCQYAFHHFEKKASFFTEAARVLAKGGRFVLQNISPRKMGKSLLYRYFPETLTLDHKDFWGDEKILKAIERAGFEGVTYELKLTRFPRPAADFAAYVARRDTNSELMAISDAAYARGLARVKKEKGMLRDEFALVTFAANKS